ncbi:MAG: hypothetical protein ABR518_05745 [Actinomycetota bacterium]
MRRTRQGHDPELDAARYLSGDGPRRWREWFESHLVACEACWAEVELGRRGRALAERARELAPADLRDRVRAAIELSAPDRSWARRLGVGIAATAVAAAVVVGGLAAVFALRTAGAQPDAIAAAVASYRSHQPSVTGPAAHHSPDLSSAGLHLTAAGRTDLDGLVSDVFTYRADGRTVFLYLGSARFPEAAGARERSGAVHGLDAMADGVALVCADSPVSYLLMSEDAGLLERAEAALRAEPVVPVGP